MLTIRFNRTGRKNHPSFRVVLQEHTVAPGGRHVEILGSYDPASKKTVLRGERIQYWIGKGAQVSDSAHNLLVREGVVEGKKRAVKMPKPVAQQEEVAVTQAAEGKAPKTEATAEEKTVA